MSALTPAASSWRGARRAPTALGFPPADQARRMAERSRRLFGQLVALALMILGLGVLMGLWW